MYSVNLRVTIRFPIRPPPPPKLQLCEFLGCKRILDIDLEWFISRRGVAAHEDVWCDSIIAAETFDIGVFCFSLLPSRRRSSFFTSRLVFKRKVTKQLLRTFSFNPMDKFDLAIISRSRPRGACTPAKLIIKGAQGKQIFSSTWGPEPYSYSSPI